MEFFTLTLLIRIITSLICSVAFALVFKINARHLPYAGIAGALAYFVYYTVEYSAAPLFVAAFASTAFTALFSEVYARIKYAPVIVLLSPGVIPIVPGADIYYTMQHLLIGEWAIALEYLARTLSAGLGIAAGIVVVSVIFRTVYARAASISNVKKSETSDK